MEVLIVIAFIAIFLVVMVWSSKHRKKQEQAWTLCAEPLGLRFSPGPHSTRYVHAHRHLPEMYGQYDGQDVYVGVRRYSTGSGKNRQTHYFTYIDAVFDISLKRGIQIVRADGVSKFFGDIFGQRDIQIGRGDFDRDFRIKGFDPEQAKGLLRDPDLLHMLQGNYGIFKISVTDERVRLEAKGVHTSAEQLYPLLAPVVAIYRKMLSGWQALPPSAEEARVTPVWQRIAQKADLQYLPRGMVIHGFSGEIKARAEVALPRGKSWTTQIRASYQPPLGVGLALSREGMLSGVGKLFGAQDIKVGDDAFDRAFVVKGMDNKRVLEILTPEAREALIALQDAGGALEVTDDWVLVSFEGIVSDEDLLHNVLEQTSAAAAAMISHRRPKPTSPYR